MSIKYIFLVFFIFIINFSYSNILYEKEGIVITEYEIKTLKELVKQNENKVINNSIAIKEYILIQKTIKKISEKNQALIRIIDEEINNQFGEKIFNNNIIKNYIRFKKIKNIYVREYYSSDLNLSEFYEIMIKSNDLQLPISTNQCLTYDGFIKIDDQEILISNLFESITTSKDQFEFNLNNNLINVCIDPEVRVKIDNLVYIQISKKIYDKIKMSVYK